MDEIKAGHQVYIRDRSKVISTKWRVPSSLPWLVMEIGTGGASIWCPQVGELCWTPVDNLVRDRRGVTMRTPNHVPPAGYRQHPGYTPGPEERVWWHVEVQALGGGAKEGAGSGHQFYAAFSELTGLLAALGMIGIRTRLTPADENGEPTGGYVWNGNTGGGSLIIRPMTWDEIENKLDRDQAASERHKAMRELVSRPSKPAPVKVGDHVIRDYDQRHGEVVFVGRDVFQVWWEGAAHADQLFYVFGSLVTPPEGGPHKLITDTGVSVALGNRED